MISYTIRQKPLALLWGRTPRLDSGVKDVTVKLAADKAATREDVDGVFNAERRNNPNSAAHPTGVAASIAVAANLNEKEFVM
ncbi:late embryogenesis abundant protein D-34-like protein [Tanacetum coccineum]